MLSSEFLDAGKASVQVSLQDFLVLSKDALSQASAFGYSQYASLDRSLGLTQYGCPYSFTWNVALLFIMLLAGKNYVTMSNLQ